MMKKILFVFGTRPEAIKMAPLVNQFKMDSSNFETVVVVTAQHREMLDQVLSLFEIVPDYDLDLMAPNQSLETLTSNILIGISDKLELIKPDIVFVQGDTTTTYATALSAFYKKLKIAHIEAGLRTNNMFSPFPEEINRRMTTSMSTFHFPPTVESKNNLLKEGIPEDSIEIAGNTVIDALLTVSKKLESNSTYYQNYFSKNFDLNFKNKRTILVTGHRRESFGRGFENICYAIKQVVEENEIQIIYPVHLNPNVQAPVNRILKGVKDIHLIPPQDYAPFIYLMKNSHIILTDSGGVQEEAPSLGKPILVMRETTERPEGVKAGTAMLVGTDKDYIVSTINSLLSNSNEYNKMSKAVNPYGDGMASEKIYNKILTFINA
jgi:UDP-N-acetylglucosamine 2-epimerase (non-hydrolysing)